MIIEMQLIVNEYIIEFIKFVISEKFHVEFKWFHLRSVNIKKVIKLGYFPYISSLKFKIVRMMN